MNKQFEEIIKSHLDQRAAEDEQFAKSYAKEGKSIEECCKFIYGEAFKKCDNNCTPMTDDEVFGLAVHYYDEDNIEITPIHGQTAVSAPYNGATYEPTEEDKENAKKAALQRLEDEAYKRLHSPEKKRKAAQETTQTTVQTSLFDLMQ